MSRDRGEATGALAIFAKNNPRVLDYGQIA
jgi:hypothetical protein